MYAIACILSYDGLPKTSAQTVAVEPIASTEDATGLRADIPSAKNAPSTTTPMGSKLKSVNTSGLGNTEETLSSNAQPDSNTAPTEQKKKQQSKSRKCKSVDNVDLGNIEENPPSDMANENEETDPNTAASEVKEPEKKRTRSKKRKSTNKLDLGNMEDNTPSDLVSGNEEESIPGNIAHGNEQPDPIKKKSKSKRRKLDDKLDSGNNMASTTKGNE